MNHTIENKKLTVTISERGASLQSIRGKTEYLWQGDVALWADRAPNLFPFVGRLNGERYTLNAKEYHLPLHGFAQHMMFSVVENTANSIVFSLTEDNLTYSKYPYSFMYQVCYKLEDSILHVTYRVQNRSKQRMYFGLGGHPGFNIPLEKGKVFEDYRVRFDPPCDPMRVLFTPDCFLTGEETPFPLQDGRNLPLRHDLFDDDAVVLHGASPCVTLEAEGGQRAVCIKSPQMQYLGFWHRPKTSAPYVCIEPWCSLPASKDILTEFTKKPDLLSLDPDKTYENNWQIEILE